MSKKIQTLRCQWAEEQTIAERLFERNQRWKELVRQESPASLNDLLIADFGIGRPNGINADHWASDETVNIQYVADKSEGQIVPFMGFVSWNEPNTVKLHPVFKPFIKTSLLPFEDRSVDMFSHETIHSRQGFERAMGAYHFKGNMFWDMKVTDDEVSEKLDKVEKHSLRTSFGKYKVKDYLANDVEIEARMHEVFSNAYAQWQRLPETRLEFFAAMLACGFKMPMGLQDEILSYDEGPQAMDDFKLHPLVQARVSHTVGLLNRVYDYAEACGKEHDLTERYTGLYGHLLELYGDPQGTIKMGYNLNFRKHLEVMQCIVKNSEPLSADEVNNLSQQLQTDDVTRFIIQLKHRDIDPNIIKTFIKSFQDQGKIHPSHDADDIIMSL